MTLRVRPLGLLVVLLAWAAFVPVAALGSSTPAAPTATAVMAAPCTGPLAALTEISNVSAIAPSRVDVLANDCVGVATASRPLRITAVGQGTYGSVSTDGSTVTYDPRGCATGDADGNDLFSYTVTDGATSKSGIAVVHVVRPATSPLTDAPQAGFIANTTLGSSVPLRVSWCGVTAAGSSVRGYRLEQGTNGGATFPTLVTAATTATSSNRNATPNAAYAWRVRTTDSKGRAGGYAASLTSKVTVVQNNSASIRYSSGWSTTTGTKYSGGSDRYTTKAGATATLTVTNARAIAIVGSRGAGRGSFNVYVDGVKVTTTAMSERASTAVWRRLLYIRSLSSGTGVSHTVQVRAVGNGRVDLDAILALSGKRDQALTFTTPAPAAQYHGPTYAAAANASSGLPVSLSVNQASWTVCSLSGGVVSFLKPGSCRIDASQSGDATWNARTSSQTFAVAPIPLTVTGITAASRPYDRSSAATLDTSLAALNTAPVVAGDVVGLNASGASGAFTDANAGNAKTVHVTGLALTGAAAAKYALTPPTTTASISKASLSVTFSTPDRPYDGTSAAAISGCTVAPVLAGDVVTCDASSATAAFGDANAGSGKSVTGSGFAVAGADAANYAITTVNTAIADIAKAGQSVGFTSTAPSAAEIGDTYTVAGSATSGLPVTFTIDPIAASVCHIAGAVVTADAEGTCIVAVDQGGDGNYNAASQVEQPFAVGTNLSPQTINFDLSGVDATYGDDPLALSATASSGLTVGFASLTPAVCTVGGTDVTTVRFGTCTIRASQPGDATRAAAPNVDQSFVVAKRPITVTAVTDTKPADGTTDSAGIPTITSGSLATGDTATWAQSFDTAAVGTGKTLTPSGTVAHGIVDVTTSYLITFVHDTTGVIDADGQTITFDLSPVDATYGDPPVPLLATATSGLTVAFTSLTPAVCTVAGTDAAIVAHGTCMIRASQPGDATWSAAVDIDQSFVVALRPITVTAASDTKQADGTTASSAVPLVTSGTLATGDTATWTESFASGTAGTGKILTPSGTVSHGLTNVTTSYLITFVTNTTGVIEPGPADATTSTIAVTPGAVNNDGVDTVAVTVHLVDAFNNSLVAGGSTVTVLADHGSVSAVTDHDDGTYTATYTSDTFSGKVTVSAEIGGTPLTHTASINQH